MIVLASSPARRCLAPTPGEILDGLSGWQSFDLFLFAAYIAYILLSITLLLNLLVAMLDVNI